MLFESLSDFSRIELGKDETLLLFSQHSSKLENSIWNYYLNFLPEHFKENVLRYKNWQDSHNTLSGKLLLYAGFYLLTGKLITFSDYRHTKDGKPYLRNSNLHFNISHSGNTTVCAFNFQSVGIDIEEIKNADPDVFDDLFLTKEMDCIKKEGILTFYKFWTIKEAVSKAIGQGLGLPFSEIKIENRHATFRNTKWQTETFELAGKYCSIATKLQNKNIKVLQIHLE